MVGGLLAMYSIRLDLVQIQSTCCVLISTRPWTLCFTPSTGPFTHDVEVLSAQCSLINQHPWPVRRACSENNPKIPLATYNNKP